MANQLSLRGELRRGSHLPYDALVVGAGPVGLAIAIELARMNLDVVLLDRRPPPKRDTALRPQLLVARRSDLANLAHLGVPIWDRRVVAPIAERHHRDLTRDRLRCMQVDPSDHGPKPETDWNTVVGQPPVALVPIGRLQQALLRLADEIGVEIRYDARATRLKRHRQYASVRLDDGASLRASLVIVATGAAQSLVPTNCLASTRVEPRRLMIGGVFAVSGEAGQWIRAEIPHLRGTVRATALATGPATDAGTALIVDAPTRSAPTPALLATCFDRAANALGLRGAYLVPPRPFSTAATSVTQRFIGGDGRAPVIIAGDAAQTGHVFSGLVGFVNLGLGLELCEQLRTAKAAIERSHLHSSTLTASMQRYQRQSEIGAALMHQASRRHFAPATAGTWAL